MTKKITKPNNDILDDIKRSLANITRGVTDVNGKRKVNAGKYDLQENQIHLIDYVKKFSILDKKKVIRQFIESGLVSINGETIKDCNFVLDTNETNKMVVKL